MKAWWSLGKWLFWFLTTTGGVAEKTDCVVRQATPEHLINFYLRPAHASRKMQMLFTFLHCWNYLYYQTEFRIGWCTLYIVGSSIVRVCRSCREYGEVKAVLKSKRQQLFSINIFDTATFYFSNTVCTIKSNHKNEIRIQQNTSWDLLL